MSESTWTWGSIRAAAESGHHPGTDDSLDPEPFRMQELHQQAVEAANVSGALLSVEQLRQQLRVRLAQGSLPIVGGVYKTHRGTGRPCIVCRRAVDAAEAQCEVDGVGVVMIAHEACYMLWREESVSSLAPSKP